MRRSMKGSIYPRTLRNGQTVWDAVIDLARRPDGTRNRKWFRGFPSAEAAQRKLAEVVLDHDGGPSAPADTLREFLVGSWMPAIRARVRPSSHDSYRRLIEQHILPSLGDVALAELTPEVLNAFYAELLLAGRKDGTGGLSTRTVLYAHTLLRKALKDGVRWGRLPENVADRADPPRSRSPEFATWSASELEGFLGRVRSDRLYACWRLAAMTGLRRGEVLALRWEDVDLDGGRIAVRQTLQAIAGDLAFGPPKSGRARAVLLDAETVEALKAHRKRQVQERLAAPSWETTLVFCSEEGEPIHPDRFSAAFRRVIKRARLPLIRLHDLRHTHATLALSAGVHPKVVAERLGHATVNVTLNTYSHVLPTLQEEAAERIAALLRGRRPGSTEARRW